MRRLAKRLDCKSEGVVLFDADDDNYRLLQQSKAKRSRRSPPAVQTRIYSITLSYTASQLRNSVLANPCSKRHADVKTICRKLPVTMH